MIVLSYYTENYSNLGNLNSKRWASYCKANGYRWCCHTPSHLTFHPYWQKIDYINQALNNVSEDVLWVDIDIIIRKFNQNLDVVRDQSSMDVLISSDSNGLCAGFMYIRNTLWSKMFFERVFDLGDLDERIQIEFYYRNLGDQNTIKYLYNGFKSVRTHICLLGQHVVSCPETKNQTAPFHHGWANAGDTTLLEELKKIES